MKKIFNLAYSNIRKGKGQSASFIIIMAICSMLMAMGLVTVFDYAKSFDKKARQLNAPDLIITAGTTDEDKINVLKNMLQSDNQIEQIESIPVMLTNAVFDFAGKSNNRAMAILDRSSEIDMGKMSIVEETDEEVDNSVILPYLFKLGGGYKIGDECEITFDGESTFRFTVSGFYEDIFFSTINTTTMGLILPHNTYVELEQYLNGKNNSILFKLKADDPDESETLSLKYREVFEDVLPKNTMVDSVNYWIVKTSRTLTASIGAMIIVGFATLLMFVSLIVINFRIKSSIDESMKNIGALKAIGYTSRQLMLSFLVQFLTLGLMGAVIGITGSYFAMPILSNMFAAQSGLIWNQLPTAFAVVVTLLVLSSMIGAISVLSAMRIRKIHPIIALRTGIPTHSFKKNHFPLDQTHMSFMACLSFKQLVIDLKQGILTCIIMIIITFTSVFAVVMYYNFAINADAFQALGGAPYLHFMLVASSPEEAEEILEEAHSRDDVEMAISYMTNAVQYEGSYAGLAYTTDNIGQINLYNPVFIYDGRYPKHENEVAINGLIAKTLNKNIGDTILIGNSDKKAEYIISGFIQGANYMGRDLCITNDGYRRIISDYEPVGVAGFMKDTEDTNAFLTDIKAKFSNILQATNSDELVKSTMAVYINIVSIIAISICIIAILIIWLVLYLVINTMLIKKKREFGIQKAIGFTTRQLVLQNVISIVPVITIGTFIGCGIGYFLMNPFIGLLFSNIGMMKPNLTVSPYICIGIFVAIVLLGIVISVFLSIRIRRISPYDLITE